MVSHLVGLLGGNGALLFYGGLAPEPITSPFIATHHEIMFKGVSSSRWLQNTSAEQRREDVAEAIEIGRAAPESTRSSTSRVPATGQS
jgi:NADPH:quinone reductase